MTRYQLLADIAALEAHAAELRLIEDARGTQRSREAQALSRILPILRTLAELSDEQRAWLGAHHVGESDAYVALRRDAWPAASAHRIAAKLFSGEP